MCFVFDMLENLKLLLTFYVFSRMAGTDFYISAYPHPQYIGSVPQAYQQFMLPIRLLCLITKSYMSFHKSSVPLALWLVDFSTTTTTLAG